MNKTILSITFIISFSLLLLLPSQFSHSQTTTIEQSACLKVFPKATHISSKQSNPPHYKAYSLNKDTEEKIFLGICFSTAELAPDIYGYGGRINLFAGVNTTNTITSIYLESHSETPSFTSNFPEFLLQFSGKSISAPLELNKDIDGMTGATISSAAVTKALQNSLSSIKTLLFNIKEAERKTSPLPFGQILFTTSIFLLSITSIIKKNVPLSRLTMFVAIVYFGLISNSMLSASHFLSLASLKILSLKSNPILFIMLFSSLLLCLVFGRIYCCNICPFAAVQEFSNFLTKKLGIKTRQLNRSHDKILQKAKYIILLAIIILSLVFKSSAIGAIEPYITLFSLKGNHVALLLLLTVLTASLFYFRFWCRFFCPTGAFLGILSRINLFGFKLSKTNNNTCVNVCPVNAIKINKNKQPYIDNSECILCQKCQRFCKK